MALDKFIYRLKNDEDITRQRLLRNEVLPAEPIRRRRQKRYLVADKHLLALAQRYAARYRANGDILRYLRCVQHHLQKPRFPGENADVDEDPLEDVADDDNGGDDDAHGGGAVEDGDRIPRRESHPGADLQGFEPEDEEGEGRQDMREGGVAEAAGENGGADPVAGGRRAIVAEEVLPGFSQADVVVRPQPLVHSLRGQSSSTVNAADFVHRAPTLAASRRGPSRLAAAFSALKGNASG